MVGDARLGTQFAGHRIERIIGRGGSSVVYLAEHVRLGRWVALKLLAPHLADDEAFRKRFVRESRLAARLDHPSIVTVYDAGEADGVLYLSMRYVEGTDLGRAVGREGALDPWRTMILLRQVAGALDAAHAEGLVHRDVKPGNILLGSGGDAGMERAFLSDFGVTKRMTSRSALTRSGQFVGTVDYVAPEQITGGDVDGRADVYSLGCVLYQCLSGKVPFPRESDVATIYGHLQDPPPSLGDLDGAWPGLDEVVARSLAKQPEDRYPTCGGLVEAARSSIGDSTATFERPTALPDAIDASIASPPSGSSPEEEAVTEVMDRPGRSRRRRVWGSVVVAGSIVLLVLALALAALSRDGSTRSTPPTGATAGSLEPGARHPKTWHHFVWNREKTRAGFAGPGEQAILDGVATSGGAIAVGHVHHTGDVSDVGIWASSNGFNWESVVSSAQWMPREQRATCVAAMGDVLVAMGWTDNGSDHDAMAWRSTDGGATWASLHRAAWSLPGDQVVRDVAETDGSFIAVGYDESTGERNGAAWRSTDGRRWTPIPDEDLGGIGAQELWAVVTDGDTVVAAGSSAERGDDDAAFWTLDGDDWQQRPDDVLAAAGSQMALSLARGAGGTYVAVGSDEATGSTAAAVWRSEDGRTWERVDLDPAVAGGEADQAMVTVTTFHGGFVAGGHAMSKAGDLDAAAWFSQDGKGWARGDPSDLALAQLGGSANQEIRALVDLARPNLALLALGVDHEEAEEDAVVWGGFPQ